MDIHEEHGTTYPHSNDISLTDAHIQQLLADAEERLRKDTIDTANASSSTSRAERTLPNVPKLSAASSLQPCVRAVIDTTRIAQPVVGSDNQSLVRNQTTSKKDKPTAGSDWFDLPQTELTPELKRDLQLLRMRSILDPKRHYKKENGKAQPPKYSQVGTIVEGPTEYFSGRIAKRDRKKTFVEEALVLERENKRFEARYNDVQDKKRSGKKAFYNNLRAKRKGGKNHG
ncbi:Fcf2 pre-rRNA processing-domain-containing protein [Aspergillus filifer]